MKTRLTKARLRIKIWMILSGILRRRQILQPLSNLFITLKLTAKYFYTECLQ